jgi:hypothetical protein
MAHFVDMDETSRLQISHNNLEEREQQLIQQVRTSGLRKQRESELVENVMELRKKRRQVHSILAGQVEALKRENEALRSSNCGVESKLKQELEAAHSRVAELKRLYHEEAVVNLERYKTQLASDAKSQIDRSKAEFKERLIALQAQMTEVGTASTQAVASQQAMAAKSIQEIHAAYASKIQKYKSLLRNMMEREPELENAGKRLKANNAALLARCEMAEQSLLSAQQTLEQSAERQKQDKQLFDQEKSSFSMESQQAKQELDTLREQHAAQLSDIDDKVRRLVREKDEIITQLRQRVSAAEEKARESEKMILEINSSLLPSTRN